MPYEIVAIDCMRDASQCTNESESVIWFESVLTIELFDSAALSKIPKVIMNEKTKKWKD